MIAVVPFNLARVLNFVYFWPQGPAQRASDCPPESASDRRFVEAFRRLLFVFFFVKKKMAFKFLSVKQLQLSRSIFEETAKLGTATELKSGISSDNGKHHSVTLAPRYKCQDLSSYLLPSCLQTSLRPQM